MMQTELQRRAYLRAMGIDVWIPRDQTDPECHAEVTEDAVEGLDWDGLTQRFLPPGSASSSSPVSRTL